MDPNATWLQLLDSLATNDGDAIREHAQDLLVWLQKGGFPPVVLPQAKGNIQLQRALALAACYCLLEQAQTRTS